MLYPRTVNTLDIRAVFDYWVKSAAFDIGEDMIIPTDRQRVNNPVKVLIAGGVSGTAPLFSLPHGQGC